MPQIVEPTSTKRYLDAHRENIRKSLDQITNGIGMALRDAGLTFPIFITVPTSGNALATIATPLDPSDEDWEHSRAIVNGIIEQTIGCGKLRSWELTCAVANAAPMAAADVTAE
jgi:hypothetical protein